MTPVLGRLQIRFGRETRRRVGSKKRLSSRCRFCRPTSHWTFWYISEGFRYGKCGGSSQSDRKALNYGKNWIAGKCLRSAESNPKDAATGYVGTSGESNNVIYYNVVQEEVKTADKVAVECCQLRSPLAKSDLSKALKWWSRSFLQEKKVTEREETLREKCLGWTISLWSNLSTV